MPFFLSALIAGMLVVVIIEVCWPECQYLEAWFFVLGVGNGVGNKKAVTADIAVTA